MSAQRVAVGTAAVTMAASGWYVVAYLGRWEWNRAIVAGVIFVAAEVGLLGVLLLDRLSRLHHRLDAFDDERRARAQAHARRPAAARSGDDSLLLVRVHEAAPTPRKPFSWLDDTSQRTSVFVPVLLGAGVLLSGAAWAVERIGRLTAGPSLERSLVHRLDALALPPGGLLGDESSDPFAPSGPGPGPE
ncbi:MAG: hypothetical protein ACRD2C_01695 [Acidimicrobiales bacterium]